MAWLECLLYELELVHLGWLLLVCLLCTLAFWYWGSTHSTRLYFTSLAMEMVHNSVRDSCSQLVFGHHRLLGGYLPGVPMANDLLWLRETYRTLLFLSLGALYESYGDRIPSLGRHLIYYVRFCNKFVLYQHCRQTNSLPTARLDPDVRSSFHPWRLLDLWNSLRRGQVLFMDAREYLWWS